MIKRITLFFLVFSVSSLFAQDRYDVRKAKWGMTKSEVISSEYPLRPAKNDTYNYYDLSFENVELSNGQTATINYKFSNGKLTEVLYIIYGSKYDVSKGTCDHIIPFIDKVHFTSSIIDGLKKKGYAYDNYGWSFGKSNISHTTSDMPFKSGFDNKTLSDVEKVAFEQNFCKIGIGLTKERTNVDLDFNEYQNCPTELKVNKLLKIPCNHEIYNIYGWLTFSPNYANQGLRYD
jgi:hypothetical protein